MRTKYAVEYFYEIEEWIPPENARANIGYWTPVCERDRGGLKTWQEDHEAAAVAKFDSLANESRRFRLVLVRRKVLAQMA